MTGQPPPKNETPADLLSRLMQTPRPHKTLQFPRKNQETGELYNEHVELWVLTESELMASRASAAKYAKKILDDKDLLDAGSLGFQEIYRNECVVQVVCRAARDPLNLRIPAFPNIDMARSNVTSDEWAVMFDAYLLWQAESGPLIGSMDDDTMNAWIERLQEGASAIPLARLSSGARDQLLMHSVSRLLRSPTGTGSPGSPADDTSNKGQEEPHASSSETVWSSSERPPELSQA